MSGNTSETRCKHCGGEEGHLVHHAGKGFKNAHKFEPTPPEGEAVTGQKRRDGHSALRVKDGTLEKFDPHPVAPMVSTAAPEQPDRLKLADSLEPAARCFYGEQYGDTPLDLEMISFAAKFAACRLTGYKTEEEEPNVQR